MLRGSLWASGTQLSDGQHLMVVSVSYRPTVYLERLKQELSFADVNTCRDFVQEVGVCLTGGSDTGTACTHNRTFIYSMVSVLMLCNKTSPSLKKSTWRIEGCERRLTIKWW